MVLRRLGSIALLLSVGLLAGTARADSIFFLGSFSGSGTDTLTGADGSGSSGLTSTVSAQVDFSYNATTGQLLMALTNTTAQNQLIGNDDALTQMAFKLSGGLTLSAGSASGKTAAYTGSPSPGTFTPSASSANLSDQWGGGKLVGSGAPAEFTLLSAAGDNYAVTSLTDELLTTGNVSYKNFNGTNLDNTTKYGLIPTVPSPQRSDNFIGNTPYGWGTVNILFTVSGPVTIDQISGVNFIFGASDPPNAIVAGTPSLNPTITGTPVPVPAAAWTGLSTLLGVGGLRILRRRRA